MMIITFSAGLDSDWSRRRPGISFRSCSSDWRNESTWTVPDARRNLLMRFKCDVLVLTCGGVGGGCRFHVMYSFVVVAVAAGLCAVTRQMNKYACPSFHQSSQPCRN